MRAVLALAIAAGQAAQTPPAAPTPPPVRIDVTVVDGRGRFVDTLRPEDFEVVEDDAAQRIAAVRLVRAEGVASPGEILPPITSAADEHAEAAREGTRLVAIYLDEYHVTPGEPARQARDLLTTLLERAVGPKDLLLVVKPLDSLIALRMTRDHGAVRRAIASFEGRKGDYEPRSPLERNLLAGTPARIDAARAQVAVSALNAMATHLGNLGAARKTLLVVSEGFAAPSRPRAGGALPTIDTIVRSANRGTVSIYPIDPRALLSPEANPHHDTLARLASETDGQAILAAAELEQGLERIARDASRYYVITLAGADDGRFHPVDVRVRVAGVRVRARRGYWAATADELYRVVLAARAEAPPPAPLLPRRASPLIRPWFGVARGPGDVPHVSFVWEPSSRVPGDRANATRPARIVLKALKPDGTTVYEGAVRPASAAVAAAETPAQLVFAAPPGRLRVELAIEDVASRVVDTDVRDVVVDPLNGPVALGTPRVLRSRTAREHRAIEIDPDAVPTASRQFSRIERLWVRVPVYAPGLEPRLSARLSSAVGGAMRELPVSAAATGGVYQIDLPLAGLAAGEYSVEIAAAADGVEAKEVVAFRVTP